MDRLHEHRGRRHFLTPIELLDHVGEHNTILSADSVLIGQGITIGYDNVFYPNVIIEQQDDGEVTIGDRNVFYPGAYLLSSAGRITIGNNNQFGPAGITIRANTGDALVEIGNDGRYADGANIMGRSTLGSGSQVLGAITVQNCLLAEGQSHVHPDPDLRAAVLKGFGLARNIELATGQVINGAGDFSVAPIEWQRTYHPKSK